MLMAPCWHSVVYFLTAQSKITSVYGAIYAMAYSCRYATRGSTRVAPGHKKPAAPLRAAVPMRRDNGALLSRRPFCCTLIPSVSRSSLLCPTLLICLSDSFQSFGAELPLLGRCKLHTGIGG